MRIKTGAAVPQDSNSEYSIAVSDLVSTAPAFDSKGRPAPDRSTVTYSLFVKNGGGEVVFESTLGDGSASALLAVQDRFVDVKLPLGGLGIDDAAKAKIDLEEADSVLRVLPYSVGAFLKK